MIDKLLTYVAPHPCFGCGNLNGPLCDNCKYDISLEPFSGCIACMRPANLAGVCRSCQLPYQRAWCVGERRDVLQLLIDGYKFKRAKACAQPLAQLLDTVIPQLPLDTVIVPIPTISAHRRERGYDQVLLVAKELGTLRSCAVSDRLLCRQTNEVQHLAKNRRERHVQAKRAFRLSQTPKPDATYLILDDVMTSGATLYYAAKTLQSAGANNIWVAVLARQTSTRED